MNGSGGVDMLATIVKLLVSIGVIYLMSLYTGVPMSSLAAWSALVWACSQESPT